MEKEKEFDLDVKVLDAIKKEVLTLKEKTGIKRVMPVVVKGDEYDDKDMYIAYFREPSFKIFSKFQTLSKNDEAQSLRGLARDCFLSGDKDLIDDESLFMFGLMPQLLGLINMREGKMVNLSKAGK